MQLCDILKRASSERFGRHFCNKALCKCTFTAQSTAIGQNLTTFNEKELKNRPARETEERLGIRSSDGQLPQRTGPVDNVSRNGCAYKKPGCENGAERVHTGSEIDKYVKQQYGVGADVEDHPAWSEVVIIVEE